MTASADPVARALAAPSRRAMLEVLEPHRPPLSQLDVRRLTARLRELRDADSPLAPLRLAIVRSYGTELLRPYLSFESLLHGFDLDLHEGPYGSLDAEADGASATAGHRPDVLYLCLRGEDLEPRLASMLALLSAGEQAEVAHMAVRRLGGLLGRFRRAVAGLIVVTLLPKLSGPALGAHDAMHDTSESRFRWALKERLVAELRTAHPGVVFDDLDLLVEEVGRGGFFDLRLWYASRYPFSAAGSAALARRLMRFPVLLRQPAVKCIAVDADNTLWGGVVGEDGLQGIALGPEYPGACYVAFQQRLRELSARGVLLALCSRNEADDVLQVLRSHPHMVLREDDFAVRRIDWRAKADNLREIARELNLGLDTLVFVDDSPQELHLVRQELPEVTGIQVPAELPALPTCLDDLTRLQLLGLTGEDRRRGELYRQERARRHHAATGGSFEEHLAALQMVMRCAVDDPAQAARIAQLTQKTNQFNLTTRRYTEAQIADFMRDPNRLVMHFWLADVFGDAGVVGVAIVTGLDSGSAAVDTFLMSCRVIGRTAETAFLEHLLARVAARGVTRLAAEYVPSPRNALVRSFWAEHGFQEVAPSRYQTVLAERTPRVLPWITVISA